MGAEARLKELGIELPPPQKPAGSYVPAVRTGNLVYLSGVGPAARPDGTIPTGKVGAELTLDQGNEAARLVGLNVLARLRDELGSLDKVVRIVKVLGMVNCSPDFTEHPSVINGFSDLMFEVFGDRGRHARSAVGMQGLPFGIACEIEIIAEVED